jgi:hypothetical protein
MLQINCSTSLNKEVTAAPGLEEEMPGRPHDLVRRRLGRREPSVARQPQRGDPGVAVWC